MTPSTNDTTTTIRAATGADLAAVERLLADNHLPLVGVAAAIEDFVVAEHAGRIIGVAGLELCCENALLRSVAVDASWRSRGIARRVIERVIADAERRGVRALYLLTTTADRYFPSIGFAVTTRDAVPDDVRATDEFTSACPASATVMCRRLATDGG